MTDLPRISIAAQISGVGRAQGRLNGGCPQATRQEIAEEMRILEAVDASLRWLENNREWIAAEALARKERGE